MGLPINIQEEEEGEDGVSAFGMEYKECVRPNSHRSISFGLIIIRSISRSEFQFPQRILSSLSLTLFILFTS